MVKSIGEVVPMDANKEFYLCLFGGMFGLHKFYIGERRKGFLYLFTLGLFGIGWLHDTIRLGMRARPGSLNIVSVETDIVYDDLDYYDALALRILYKNSSGGKDKFLQAVKDHTSNLKQDDNIIPIELEWVGDNYIEATVVVYVLNET